MSTWRVRNADALALLDERDAYMRTLGGCSDGGCIIVKPIGMHTNGGCKCSLDGFKTQRVMYMDNKTLDALRALLTQELNAWQPIETAPKDELILVGPTKRMGICAAMHHSLDGWVTETCSGWSTIYTPTHWQPLPAPPRLAGKEKAE